MRGGSALAVWAVAIEHGRRCRPCPRPLVAHIGPQPRRAGAAGAGGQHRHGRIVGVQHGACHHVVTQRVHQRVAAGPRIVPTQSAKVDRLSSSSDRARISAWRYSGRWSAYLDTSTCASRPAPARPRRIGRLGGRRLADRLALAAGALGADMAHHPEPARHPVQHLGHILAERPHGAAAGRAGCRREDAQRSLVAGGPAAAAAPA